MASQSTTTAARAITDLTLIDGDIATLLSTASSAIRCLTTPESADTNQTATEAFTAHATTYHTLLSSIMVRLRRQILQLQAAEIPVVAALDAGVLNSRNDVVGREMEAECWSAARKFLEELQAVNEVPHVEGEEMEVDP